MPSRIIIPILIYFILRQNLEGMQTIKPIYKTKNSNPLQASATFKTNLLLWYIREFPYAIKSPL